jgi:hypothetical protein
MLQIKSKQSFQVVLNNLAGRGNFVILRRGRRSTIIANNKEIAYHQDGISKEVTDKRIDASQIMIQTRSLVTRYITKELKKGGLPEIERLHPVCYSNRELWNELPAGTEFYLIDASHCYWRIAYVMGCINEKLYSKYAEDKDYKTLRLIALSILVTRIKREYYRDGKLAYELETDTDTYRVVYQNIRYYAYNNSGQVKDAMPDLCIGYRVDGIYLLPEGLRKAKAIFKKNGLLYKTVKCIKVDDKNYSTSDGEIKKII